MRWAIYAIGVKCCMKCYSNIAPEFQYIFNCYLKMKTHNAW